MSYVYMQEYEDELSKLQSQKKVQKDTQYYHDTSHTQTHVTSPLTQDYEVKLKEIEELQEEKKVKESCLSHGHACTQ